MYKYYTFIIKWATSILFNFKERNSHQYRYSPSIIPRNADIKRMILTCYSMFYDTSMHMAFEPQGNTPNEQCQIMSMKRRTNHEIIYRLICSAYQNPFSALTMKSNHQTPTFHLWSPQLLI